MPAVIGLVRTTMDVMIREAVPGDEDVLAELNAFVQEFHVVNNPSFFRPTDAVEVASWFRGLIETPGARIWIAEQGGSAVGYVVALLRERPANPFCLARRWIELDQIGVRAACRRAGIARRLVDQVLSFARAEAVTEVELSSWSFNPEAHQAFQKLGFAPRIVRFGRTLDAGDSMPQGA